MRFSNDCFEGGGQAFANCEALGGFFDDGSMTLRLLGKASK